MRGTQLSRAHVMAELGRLLRVFKRPAHASEDLAQLAGDYAEICGDVSEQQFTQAVSEYLKSEARFFPKPGELRGLAKQQRGIVPLGAADPGSFDEWLRAGYRIRRDGPLTPCPACSRFWEDRGRMKLIHDHARHATLGLPCVGHCDDPMCIGDGTPAHAAQRSAADCEPVR